MSTVSTVYRIYNIYGVVIMRPIKVSMFELQKFLAPRARQPQLAVPGQGGSRRKKAKLTKSKQEKVAKEEIKVESLGKYCKQS